MTDDQTPEKLVSGVISLISLPEVCQRLQLVLSDPDHDRNTVARLINQDPALTLRLLRIVNSAYYGMMRTIDTVSQAVSVIGEEDLMNLVLATSATTALSRLSNPMIDFQVFWRHSIQCGLVARAMAQSIRQPRGEVLFIAGLLHDIGKVVLYHQMPDLARAVRHEIELQGCSDFEAEQRMLDFDHSQVGEALIRAWGLPETLSQSIGCHHQPLNAKTHGIEACLVYIANFLLNQDIMVSDKLGPELKTGPELAPEVLRITRVDWAKTPKILESAHEQCKELQAIFCR